MEMKATHKYTAADGSEWLLKDCGNTYFYKQTNGNHADCVWSTTPSLGNVVEIFGRKAPGYCLTKLQQFKGNK